MLGSIVDNGIFLWQYFRSIDQIEPICSCMYVTEYFKMNETNHIFLEFYIMTDVRLTIFTF